MRLTREQVERLRGMELDPDLVSAVNITDIWIERQTQISIVKSAHMLAEVYNLNMSDMREILTRELYWHLDTEELGIMIRLDDTDVENMYVRIPEGRWGFREGDDLTQ